jgi:hypothetical protein
MPSKLECSNRFCDAATYTGIGTFVGRARPEDATVDEVPIDMPLMSIALDVIGMPLIAESMAVEVISMVIVEPSMTITVVYTWAVWPAASVAVRLRSRRAKQTMTDC